MKDWKMSTAEPKATPSTVTVAVPSYEQGSFLESTLTSILEQTVLTEICVADGGSRDKSAEIISQYQDKLHWSRSRKDEGQSAAINEAVSAGKGDYVCWLNSDDRFTSNGLVDMALFLDKNPDVPMVYGDAWYIDQNGKRTGKYSTHAFDSNKLAKRCFICQPATLIRRSVWEDLGGVDETLHMTMDYDLWWRIFKNFGEPGYLPRKVAEARLHSDTKTNTRRKAHYQEAMQIIKQHHESLPMIWYLKWPWSVWYKSFKTKQL